ncbi:NUDIX domain-containing protein [Streptomyces sp. NPDC005897]|uniref:NUDIX domain-containing protein n=1 Tax=Streptomyces sp. NPDC005897 TaxID=3157081 RepID=UPI0033FECFFF
MSARLAERRAPHPSAGSLRDGHRRARRCEDLEASTLPRLPLQGADEGEDPLRTAQREAVEETGLERGLGTPKLLLTHFLHSGPRLPLNKVGLHFDGDWLTADQLDRIHLDPAEQAPGPTRHPARCRHRLCHRTHTRTTPPPP